MSGSRPIRAVLIAAVLAFLFSWQPSLGQTWRLAAPEEGQPGFHRGFGQNVYVRAENSPGLQLTRSAYLEAPTRILSDSTYPGRSSKAFPTVAVANDGSVLAFWIDSHNRFQSGWRARRISPDGLPQGDEMTLPQIPADAWWLDEWRWDLATNGERIVWAWEQGDDIYYQVFDFDLRPITEPRQANQDTVVEAPFGEWHPGTSSPTVSMTSDGNFVIAWQDDRRAQMVLDYDVFIPAGDTGEIYARRFDRDGLPMGDNFLVNQDSVPRVQLRPAIAMDETGSILCMWLETDTSRAETQSPVVRGRVLGDGFARDVAGSGDVWSYWPPVVASAGSGFAALWRQRDTLAVQALGSDGTPLWPARKVTVGPTSSFTLAPTAGGYAALWSTWPPHFNTEIRVRVLDVATGSLAPEQTLVSDGTLSFASGTASGTLAVAYLREQKTAVGVAASTGDLQALYEIPRLNTDVGGATHRSPVVARLEDDRYLVVWTDGRSGVLAVYGQVIDAQGNKVGENFPVYAPEEHLNHQTPVVASLPEGGAIVAYRSQKRSGRVFGAWLQRIATDGSLDGLPIKLNTADEEFIWDVQVVVGPGSPAPILGVWNQDQEILGQLLNNDLHKLGNSRILGSRLRPFTIAADHFGRFWLVGYNWDTGNILLKGFDSNLAPIYGPVALNDSTRKGRAPLQPQLAMLDDGTFLVAWGTRDYGAYGSAVVGQILDASGSRVGQNLTLSDVPHPSSLLGVDWFTVGTSDSLFVVSWNQRGRKRNNRIGIGWFDRTGMVRGSPAVVPDMNFVSRYAMQMTEGERMLFLHEAYGNPNPIDVAFDAVAVSGLSSEGWYVSPIFRGSDSLAWRKVSWDAETPPGTEVRVFFRADDRLNSPLDPYIPWQPVDNGQTESLPKGNRAQWRVELRGTAEATPIVYDLVAEYERTVPVLDRPSNPPLTFDLLPSFPNPTRSSTTIVYELPAAVAPTITIYNVRGQTVRQWSLPRQAAGRHRVTWDGRRDDGTRVPSGIYFVKLVAGEQALIQRLLLLR
jgi:hypothetical protein